MNYLLSSYSVNPYNGSEDGVGWSWALQLDKNCKDDDRVILLTKKYNEADTRRGIEEFGLKHIELQIVDVPNALNWFREKHSMFHHAYYMLWQAYAYRWAKRSGIKFDVVHHITMGDFRILGRMYKFKDAYTIFGPVGGGQSTPKPLKCYENHPAVERFREIVNKSRAISPKYKRGIKQFNAVYGINGETVKIISKAMNKPCNQLFELALANEFKNLDIPNRNNEKKKIIFVGRLIAKKGLMLLLDAIDRMDKDIDFVVDIYGDGPLKEPMQDYINSHNLCDKVILHGNVEHTEISSAYINGDCFVMPSLRETSGNVIIEAMAHKLPIVALDMSICHIIKDEELGLFIDINQSKDEIINEMADKLTTLITNDELAKRLGENGYTFVNTQLSWQEKYDTIYKSIE